MAFADKEHRLEVETARTGGGLLLAPIRTEMHKRVEESLDARVHVRLSKVKGGTVFEETGAVGGLEVHGELDRLTTMAKRR